MNKKNEINKNVESEKKVEEKSYQIENIDNEISLVDIAKIIVKRKMWFFVLWGGFSILGIIYASTIGESRIYTSQYQIAESLGEKGKISSLEPIQLLLRKIEEIYFPHIKRKYKKENNGEILPLTITLEPKSNFEFFNYITISSVASPINKSLVEAIHKEILETILKEQDNAINSKKEDLINIIKNNKNSKSTFKETSANANSIEPGIFTMAILEKELSSLKNGKILTIVEEDETSRGRLKTILISSVVGFVLGLLGVFFVEFYHLVRLSLEEDKQKG